MRANDGAVDSGGRFWVGTMEDVRIKVPADEGVLFRLDPDGSVHRVLEKLTIPMESVGIRRTTPCILPTQCEQGLCIRLCRFNGQHLQSEGVFPQQRTILSRWSREGRRGLYLACLLPRLQSSSDIASGAGHWGDLPANSQHYLSCVCWNSALHHQCRGERAGEVSRIGEERRQRLPS
jgi:hypothetical protein